MRLPILIGLAALVGVLALGTYVFDFTAYLGNNPTTCNNCHVMDAVYESWYHAGHKSWAVCNDCHTPHALIPKYIVKATNGFRHVSAFTLGHIPEAIRAKESSKWIIQENCVRCHEATIADLDWGMAYAGEDERFCYDCHRDAAHGERGLSLLPYKHSEEYK
jgi:cytochrome c nitrite reductase small subunit